MLFGFICDAYNQFWLEWLSYPPRLVQHIGSGALSVTGSRRVAEVYGSESLMSHGTINS